MAIKNSPTDQKPFNSSVYRGLLLLLLSIIYFM